MSSISYYFCTKPLQYFNCVNISGSDPREKVLFVISYFNNVDKFIAKIIKYDKRWSKVVLLKSKKDKLLCEYKVTNADVVYTHSDLHNELCFKGDFRRANIKVYEEGLGTYTRDITDVTNKNWKNFIFRVLTKCKFINSTAGMHKLTKSIFVYNKDKFDSINPELSNKSSTFDCSFVDNYLSNRIMFDRVFELNNLKLFSDKRVALFLTGNDINVDYLSFFEKVNNTKYDVKVFKPHPNVASKYQNIANEYSVVMAELLISKLVESGNQVDVYHYGTAVTLYIESDFVHFIQLNAT